MSASCVFSLSNLIVMRGVFLCFKDTATTEIYTLSLHDALPIYQRRRRRGEQRALDQELAGRCRQAADGRRAARSQHHRASPEVTLPRANPHAARPRVLDPGDLDS